VEIRDGLLQAGQPAWQVRSQRSLVAVIDPNVRVNIPEQHAIDPAEAALEIIEISIDGIFPSGRVVEIPVFDHHLGVYEVALRPFELGSLVVYPVVTHPDEMLMAPLAEITHPRGGRAVHILPPITGGLEGPTRRTCRQR
jgi:hypothetical protein